MSSNYDYEPPDTEPWWPGIVALLVLAVIVASLAFCHHKP